MKYPGRRIRTLALLLTLLILGVFAASPAARAEFLGLLEPEPPPTAQFSSEPAGPPAVFSAADAFHWLDPIAPSSGDTSNLDASLLNYLKVEVCQVTGGGCTTVKTFTSTGSSAEQLRIVKVGSSGGYYIVNWDTQKSKISLNATYRIIVSIPGLELGSIDLAPATYRTFGRTWPIKFLVEKDPAIQAHLLGSLGLSIWQVADRLRTEFGICGEELRLLLLELYPLTFSEEVQNVVAGVCQEAKIPLTTKIVDGSTSSALTLFDPVTGQMQFAGDTALLKGLSIDDVLASQPSAAAPHGYLRKVTSIRKEKGRYVIETAQASLNESIKVGFVDSTGPLEVEDPAAVETLAPGVTFRTLSEPDANLAPQFGDGESFEASFDETFKFDGSEDGLEGSGEVTVKGFVRFKAGYDFGLGVEECFEFPPVCVDRFEGRMGVDQYSKIEIEGKFDGSIEKEKVVATKLFKPITIFIGPFPIVLVPVIDIVVGMNGKAHVDFRFAAELSEESVVGAKWTDPDDGGQGWENVSKLETPTGKLLDKDLNVDMRLVAYGKGDAKLLLYGVAGPGFGVRAGFVIDVATGRMPLWKILGHVAAEVSFQVDFGGLLKIAEFKRFLLNEDFLIEAASNQPPDCSPVTDVIKANVDAKTYLGPSLGGIGGYFNCIDPEGELISYKASSSNDSDFIEELYMRATFKTGGTRDVKITATDASGGSNEFTLKFEVVNSLPVVQVFAATDSVPVGVQFFLTALAFDWESGGYLDCIRVDFSTLAPAALRDVGDSFNCVAEVIFTQPGTHKIKVKATDRHGGSTEYEVSVNVTSAPGNSAPVIDASSVDFDAVAVVQIFKTGLGDEQTIIFCFPDTRCPIPNGETLLSPTGSAPADYRSPFYLSLNATDPDGPAPGVKWYCRVGSNVIEAAAAGDGSYSCSTFGPAQQAFIWAEVSDGTTKVYSEMHNYFMASVIN